MNTINQIGKAALSRIFKSGEFTEQGIIFYKTVGFPPCECDLTEVLPLYEKIGNKEYRSMSGQKVQVWGIKTGLQDIGIIKGDAIFESLVDASHSWEKEDSFPSHLIVIWWEKSFDYLENLGRDHLDVFIYRISDEQKKQIMKKSS